MPTSLAAVFGANLRVARERLGRTQAEVARELGMATEAYGRLERGHALPRATTLVALARLLETSTDELLGVAAARRTRHSLADDVGAPRAGYPASAGKSPELRRLISRLERLEPAAVQAFARLAALVGAKKSRGKRR